MKRILILMTILLCIFGCSKKEEIPDEEIIENKEEAMKELVLKIDDQEVKVNWEDNESVEALKDLVLDQPLTIDMSMYGGFEQVGEIGTSITRNDSQTTTNPGDIVLYAGDNIVIFYGSNSWAYTRLGKIQNLNNDELKELLGNHDVKVELSLK